MDTKGSAASTEQKIKKEFAQIAKLTGDDVDVGVDVGSNESERALGNLFPASLFLSLSVCLCHRFFFFFVSGCCSMLSCSLRNSKLVVELHTQHTHIYTLQETFGIETYLL